MPLIGGRYYANPAYGRALERARTADQENARKAATNHQDPQSAPSQAQSWEERLVKRVALQPPPPPRPAPPPVNQRALERSVDITRVNTLTVHQVGLIVFNESQSLSTSQDSNESIDAAREKVAHAVMNGDMRRGLDRPITAPAAEPSPGSLRNRAVRTAYESSIVAAQRAYLEPDDPTRGAMHFNMRPDEDRKPFQGHPLRTQLGPYQNSRPSKDLPARKPVFVNIYE